MGKESDFSSFTVHDLPKPERPRERLGNCGWIKDYENDKSSKHRR
jgi:hypothetical protein